MPEPQQNQDKNIATISATVSPKEFADKIRAKYPDSQLYKTKPDKELIDAWIGAKPERDVYKNRIREQDPNKQPAPTFPIKQQEQESFYDTIKRAGEAGAKVTPEQINKSTQEGLKQLPTVLGTASVIGFSGPAMLALVGEVLTIGSGAGKIAQATKRVEEAAKAIKTAKDAASAAKAAGKGAEAAKEIGNMSKAVKVYQKAQEVVKDVTKSSGRINFIKNTATKVLEHAKQEGTIIKTPYGRAIEYFLLYHMGFSKAKLKALIE
jgi:hypothetical protein